MKRIFSLAVLCFSLTAALQGCATTLKDSTGVLLKDESKFQRANVLLQKEFEPIGLVFAESVIDVQKMNTKDNQEGLTYYQLLQEAQKLKADAIINVTIEQFSNCKRVDKESNCILKRYGSALAIRYKDTFISDNLVIRDNMIIRDGLVIKDGVIIDHGNIIKGNDDVVISKSAVIKGNDEGIAISEGGIIKGKTTIKNDKIIINEHDIYESKKLDKSL